MGHRVAVTTSIFFPHHVYKHAMHPQTRADATGTHFRPDILIMSRRGSSQVSTDMEQMAVGWEGSPKLSRADG